MAKAQPNVATPMPQATAKRASLTATDVLSKLKKLGKPGTAAIYRRHGATGEVWGVSFADFGKLAKQIRTNHALARQLWDSGVVDARTLALMVADPAAMTPAVAEKWLREANAPVLLQYLAQLVAQTVFAPDKLAAWTKSAQEFPRTCGYTLLAMLLRTRQVSEADARGHLSTIEQSIRASPNRAREAMNMALIAIGGHLPELERDAIAAARRIGRVEVDHGETGCKTPDAEQYILKIKARKMR